MKTNLFKDFVNIVIDGLKKDSKTASTFNSMTAKKQKRVGRKTAIKEVKKHYHKRGIKHFDTFSPRKPINW